MITDISCSNTETCLDRQLIMELLIASHILLHDDPRFHILQITTRLTKYVINKIKMVVNVTFLILTGKMRL